MVGGDAEQMLQNVQGNLTRLTHKIPMTQVDDLLEAMQRQVIGVPRAWLWLFIWVARVVMFFHDQHAAPQDQTP